MAAGELGGGGGGRGGDRPCKREGTHLIIFLHRLGLTSSFERKTYMSDGVANRIAALFRCAYIILKLRILTSGPGCSKPDSVALILG